MSLPVNAAGNGTDLAALRAANHRLAAELARARMEIDQLAYSATHQLRAPLRAMHGLVQALREDFAGALPAHGEALLDQLVQSSAQASMLLEGLVRLSRAATRPLQPEQVDVTALAAAVVDHLVPVPAAAARWQIDAGLSAWADAGALREILEEACANALRFSAAHPQAAFVIRAHTGPDGLIWLSVRDGGAGFDPRHVAKLFQPFQRLHGEQEFPGIGVGLALSARLVERHGGLIRLRNVAPHGAQLEIWLPPAGASQPA